MEATSTQAIESAPTKPGETEDVFGQIDHIYNSIARRAFEIFSRNGQSFGHDVENWFQAESDLLHPVRVEMTDDVGAVNLNAEVPGFEANNLEIKLEPNRITISGKKETKEEGKTGRAVHHEHCANQFLRVIDLPAVVDASKAAAKLKNGILKVHMPKGKAGKTTRVRVTAG